MPLVFVLDLLSRRSVALPASLCLVCALALDVTASSHREAPFVTTQPKVDATDFYMFRSYEPGREDFVTIVANYLPLQDPYGGPNYFSMDPDALYEIHLDTDGDALEDITFQFQFQNDVRKTALPIGPPGNRRIVTVPFINVGAIPASGDDDPRNPSNLNVRERYALNLIRGDRRLGSGFPISSITGESIFVKPVDRIGTKSIPDYDSYASNFVYDIDIPGSPVPGRMFVGQRKDPFVVNLGETFDLVNLDPTGPENGRGDDLADKNITSFIIELPIDFLIGDDPVIGGWTTASLPRGRLLNPCPLDETGAFGSTVSGGGFQQVSRLGSPLVNEVVIGLSDKDRFNASEPVDDAQFLDYVTNPTLPAILEVLFGAKAPTLFPRGDLVGAFLTGFDGLNGPIGVVPGEMLRLNTAIEPTPRCDQDRLGVIAGDLAGFPNGRRPGDDVVDIALRVVMGVLLPPEVAPAGQLPFTDGAIVDSSFFDADFPYLTTPIPGSPSDFVNPSPAVCLDVPTEGPCADGECSRVVIRNFTERPVFFLATSANQVINDGELIRVLPFGGEFSEGFDEALVELDLILVIPELGITSDLNYRVAVPIGSQFIHEENSGGVQRFCIAPLGANCPPLPE